MKNLLMLGALLLAACGGGTKTTNTASPAAPATGSDAPACQGHMAAGQCYPDFAAACAALACQAPDECISLESMPPQAECRAQPK